MELPVCHSRRTLADDPTVLYCAHPDVHARDERVSAEVCGCCDRWREPAPGSFRPFPPIVTPARAARGECVHLGEPIGLKLCRSCRGTVMIKTFHCRHPAHGQTTVAECGACPDHLPVQMGVPSRPLEEMSDVDHGV